MRLKAIEIELKEKLQAVERLKQLEKEEQKLLNEISKLGDFEGTIVAKYVRCGKGCKKCPHGPYYYLVKKENGRTKWRYLGTNPPSNIQSFKERIKEIQKEKRTIIKSLKL